MNGAAIIVGNYESPQRGGDFRGDFSGPSRREVGGRSRSEGRVSSHLLFWFHLSQLLSFLSTVERWKEVAWLWLRDGQWGHTRVGVLKSSIKVETTCERNLSG